MNTEIKRCLDWFDAYTRDYVNRASKDILLTVQSKISHTMRVLAHVRGILRETPVREDLAPVAEVAAILHDVGRFPQLINSASFDDRTGYNHAEEGERILRMADVLEPFDETFRELVLTAVRHHNLGLLPEDLTDDERLVLEILRDADKLDALRNTVKYMSPDTPYGKALKSGMIWHDSEVSDEVVKLTLQRKLIPFTAIKWSNDFVLFLTCWIHDLHFPYAYRHLHESGTFEALLDALPEEAPFDRIKKQLRSDLQRFLDQG
jgi:hypothetical protein